MKLFYTFLFLVFYNVSLAQAHHYDDLHRLDTITYNDGTKTFYTYDAVGNRLGVPFPISATT